VAPTNDEMKAVKAEMNARRDKVIVALFVNFCVTVALCLFMFL
jgi:hypothetical protein